MHKVFIFCCLLGLAGQIQVTGPADKVIAFSLETYTRGYRKIILIRSDSTFIQEFSQPGKKIRRKTQKSDWAGLQQSIAAYRLIELTDLPAPTNNRARDAARTSVILIKTDKKIYNSGFFDDQKPNPKLEALMKLFNQAENSKPGQ